MRVTIETACLPKAGNQQTDYEDAYAPSSSTGPLVQDGRVVSAAIADGVSDGVFSGRWAQLVAQAYVDDPRQFWRKSKLNLLVRALSPEWRHTIDPDVLPWYVQDKLSRGAATTLAGVTVYEKPDHRCRLFAVGDSCIFQIRAHQLIDSIPYADHSDFDNHPAAIPTREEAAHTCWLRSVRHTRSWQHGDCFILMTDALAAWFLRNWREPGIIETIMSLTHNEFEQFVNKHRALRVEQPWQMRNDDVTMLRCTVEEG